MQSEPLKIIVADDEPLMRGLLTSYLSKECKHEIHKAVDGREALNLYKTHAEEIDIIFLDIEMPKLNGLEVLKEVRAINAEAYVVIISGVGTLSNVKSAIDAGVNGFIVKPFTNGKIAEALSNYYKHVAIG